MEYSGFIAVDAPSGRVSFGGLRIAPSVTPEIVLGLAQAMRLKYALHGLPVGGAKGGLRCHADYAHRPEVIRSFCQRAESLLKSQVIIGKDLGASNEWLDRCYQELGVPQLYLAQKKWSSDCPNRIRDLSGYVKHMTGLGVAWSTDAALKILGRSTEGARILVQGCGRVGFGSAVQLARLGAVLVGISDRNHALYHPDGIPLAELESAKDEWGMIRLSDCTFTHRRLKPDTLLSCEADVLVLAADSGLIDEALARTIQAPVIVEGANAPILPGGDQILHEAGRWVIPDVLASSSSSALVGHQMVSGNRRSPEETWHQIEMTIRSHVPRIIHKHSTDLFPREALKVLLKGTNEFSAE